MFSSGSTSDGVVTDMSTIESVLDSLINPPSLSSIPSATPVQTYCEEVVKSSETSDDDDSRPKHSYLALTTMALQDQPKRQGNLKAIYHYITTNFPYYSKNRKHWKNSVRHNLALHSCFKRLDTENDRIKGAGGKFRSNPLWALVSVPDSSKLLIPRRDRNKSAELKKRKSDNPLAKEKSTSSKKPKVKANNSEMSSPPACPSAESPLPSISMMLPKIGSTDACQPSSSHRGLLQPPVTPESDYGSLCSDRCSPFIPEQPHEFPSSNPALPSPSPRVQDDGFNSLPRLSVQDICAVLQCDEFPRSPDSGTGLDLLDGFGWLDDDSIQEIPTLHPQPCLADTLLDEDDVFVPRNFTPEPAAVSYFVPKVPVDLPLSVGIQNFSL